MTMEAEKAELRKALEGKGYGSRCGLFAAWKADDYRRRDRQA